MTEKTLIIFDLFHKGREDCIEDIADKDYVAGTLLWPFEILAFEIADIIVMTLFLSIPPTAFIAALAP